MPSPVARPLPGCGLVPAGARRTAYTARPKALPMKRILLLFAAAAAVAVAVALPPPACAAPVAEPEPEAELAALQAHADAGVRALRFDTLDAEADALRASRARLADGRWKLSMLFGAIGDAMSHVVVDEGDRRALEAAAAGYARAHPTSANAGLFLARVHLAEGWMARGRGDWLDVPADGRRRFEAALAQARADLDERRATLAANPMWYADRIEVASLAGEPQALVDGLLREALAREPRFHAAAFAALAARSPRRGGSTSAMMRFIDTVGVAGEGPRAEGLYVRLVMVAQEDYPRIEADPALDWAATTRAFDAILGSYPAPRNVRRFLLMACDHPDRTAARVLLRYVTEPASAPAASASPPPHGGGLERCMAWARATPAPADGRGVIVDTGRPPAP
jgi:hypothetical protein